MHICSFHIYGRTLVSLLFAVTIVNSAVLDAHFFYSNAVFGWDLDLPFSSSTLSPAVSSQMKNTSLNRVIKIQPDCTMSEVLAKAEKVENSKVPFSLSLASKMSKDTRTSLQNVIS